VIHFLKSLRAAMKLYIALRPSGRTLPVAMPMLASLKKSN
jgi:hypothetical protein